MEKPSPLPGTLADERPMFWATTTNGVPFRAVWDAQAHCGLREVTIRVDKEGLTMTTLTPPHNMVVHVLLERDSFGSWGLREDQILVPLAVSSVQRALRGVTNKDTVTLSISYEDPKHLTFTVFNEFTQTAIVHKVLILVMPYERIRIPPKEVDRIVSMPSNEFAKYVKDFAPLAKELEFYVDGQTFCIRAEGDMCESRATIKPKENVRGEKYGNGTISIGLGRKGKKTARGMYNSKYLMCIIKSTNLDEQVTLYLTDEAPILIRYNVSIMGSIVFILANKPETKEEEEPPVEQVEPPLALDEQEAVVKKEEQKEEQPPIN